MKVVYVDRKCPLNSPESVSDSPEPHGFCGLEWLFRPLAPSDLNVDDLLPLLQKMFLRLAHAIYSIIVKFSS